MDFNELHFGLFWTWILQATQAVRIKSEVDQKQILSKSIFQKSIADQKRVTDSLEWCSEVELYSNHKGLFKFSFYDCWFKSSLVQKLSYVCLLDFYPTFKGLIQI